MAQGYARLLRCLGVPVARCLVRCAGNAIGFGIAGDLLVEVAEEAWALRQREGQADQAPGELQALAQAPAAEVAAQARLTAEAVAAGQPPAVRQAVETYLRQVPALVRQTLRRPTDPAGLTLPPGLALRQPADLLAFLPSRLPRFQPGAQPLAASDLELIELLGIGGFGEVWKARHLDRPKAAPVALKFCTDPTAARALRNELELLDRVAAEGRHEGIVHLLYPHLRADPPFLEYEFVEGGDLAGLIPDWRRRAGAALPGQAAKVVQRLAEIVGFAHRLKPPIVHRDLKPANVLVQVRPDGKYAFKVADFGIGGVAAEQALAESTRAAAGGRPATMPTGLRGTHTPLYASPQQKRGGRPDPRDDVFALGILWYQLLTGNLADERPGGTRWTGRLRDLGVAAAQVDLLASCFEDEPADRPADAAVLAEQLARQLAPAAPPAPPRPPAVVAPPRPAAVAPPPPPPPPRPPTTPAPPPAAVKPPATTRPAFKMSCPSCEAQVAVLSVALIGQKIECPKCKYRFKVEDPASAADTPEPKQAKKAKGR